MQGARALRGLLLAVLAAGRLAGETPAPAVPSGESALAAAQRDYQVIQRAQSSPELQQLAAPVSAPSAPPLPAGEPPADLNLSVRRPLAKPAKSANWLLDAMAENNPASLDDMKGGRLSAGTRSEDSFSGRDPTGPLAASKPAEGAYNPLASYMSSWMTPHDLEVLKAKGANANDPSLDKPLAPGGGREGLARGVAGQYPSQTPGPGLEPHGANPYLTEIAPAAPGNGGGDLLFPPNSLAPGAGRPVLTPESPPLKSPPPPTELLKTQDDSSYFPQLKHF